MSYDISIINTNYSKRYKELKKEYDKFVETHDQFIKSLITLFDSGSTNDILNQIKIRDEKIKELNEENEKLKRKIIGMRTTIEHVRERNEKIYNSYSFNNSFNKK